MNFEKHYIILASVPMGWDENRKVNRLSTTITRTNKGTKKNFEMISAVTLYQLAGMTTGEFPVIT